MVKIEEITLFENFKDKDFRQLKACLHEKTFSKGEILFREGECCERVFFIAAGRIKIYQTAENGREQIFEILEEGDSCACNAGHKKWNCSATGEALSNCVVWFLSRNDYSGMVVKNEVLSRNLLELFSRKIKDTRNLVGEVSLKDVKKRLIKFLLDMHQKQSAGGSPSMLEIPFTREELAQRLGSTRETVTRYLTQLKEDGLIDILPSKIKVISGENLSSELNAPAR